MRAAIRVRTSYGTSSMETDSVSLRGHRDHQPPALRLDWHEHQKMLKFSFPWTSRRPKPVWNAVRVHQAPGRRSRVSGTAMDRRYRLSGQLDVRSRCHHDAKYGYSVDGSDLRISIARSAVFALHMPHKVETNREYIWQDQGIQTFRMLLVPHTGAWQERRCPTTRRSVHRTAARDLSGNPSWQPAPHPDRSSR